MDVHKNYVQVAVLDETLDLFSLKFLRILHDMKISFSIIRPACPAHSWDFKK
jgi:hypothetical protein